MTRTSHTFLELLVGAFYFREGGRMFWSHILFPMERERSKVNLTIKDKTNEAQVVYLVDGLRTPQKRDYTEEDFPQILTSFLDTSLHA